MLQHCIPEVCLIELCFVGNRPGQKALPQWAKRDETGQAPRALAVFPFPALATTIEAARLGARHGPPRRQECEKACRNGGRTQGGCPAASVMVGPGDVPALLSTASQSIRRAERLKEKTCFLC